MLSQSVKLRIQISTDCKFASFSFLQSVALPARVRPLLRHAFFLTFRAFPIMLSLYKEREEPHLPSLLLLFSHAGFCSYVQMIRLSACCLLQDIHTDKTMIREKVILCKLNILNISDAQLIRAMIPQTKACPHCGAAGRLAPHDSYERWLICICEGVRKEEMISVPRLFCSSCEHTHAVLADILIPFSSYSLRFILHVLKAYLTGSSTVASVCDQFGIATSTLYVWIHRFKEHGNLWLPVLQRIEALSLKAISFFEDINMLPQAFFTRYQFSFLQGHKTTDCQFPP
jgi:ribosomal protein S27AE